MPIDRKFYNRKPEFFWIGRKVRSVKELKNGWFTAPVGTEFVVTRKQMGLHLKLSAPCPCCGLRGYISKVAPDALELLE